MLTPVTVRRIIGWNSLIALRLLSARAAVTSAIIGVSGAK